MAKAVVGYDFGAAGKNFTIYVTNASGEYVLADGSISATKTGISVPANGSVTINDIPVGTYNVSEDPTGTAITNYDLVVSGEGDVNVTKDTVVNATVTNTYTYLTTSVTVKKAWNDNNNKANKRPGFVTVQLYAGTTISGIPVQLDESNGWTKTWDNLPKYDANGLIQYTVKEVNVPKEYTDSITTDPATGEITITNTRTSTKGKLVLTKTVVGDVDKAEAENVIKFKITDEAGNSETYALTDFQYDVSTKKYTLELDKPAGTYTIEEIQYDIDGYETSSIKYVVETGLQKDGKSAEATVVVDETVNVAFVDTYDKTTTTENTTEVTTTTEDTTEITTTTEDTTEITTTTEDTTEVTTTTEDKPSTPPDTPKTGDDAPLMPLVILFMLSAAGVVTVIVVKKKNDRADRK